MNSASALADRSGETSSSSSATTKAFASRCPWLLATTVPSACLSAVRAAAVAAGGFDPINGTVLPAQPAGDSRSTKRCSRSTATRRAHRRRFSLARWMQRSAAAGTQTSPTVQRIGCANKRHAVAEQHRQRKSDRGQDRPHAQCQQQRVVSLSAGHGAAGRIHRSDQSDLQCLLPAAAADAGDWLHAHLHTARW